MNTKLVEQVMMAFLATCVACISIGFVTATVMMVRWAIFTIMHWPLP